MIKEMTGRRLKTYRDKFIFRHGGTVPEVGRTSSSSGVFTADGGYIPHPCMRFVCDTAEEAETIRLLLEHEREELEAVRRKYEMLLGEACHA